MKVIISYDYNNDNIKNNNNNYMMDMSEFEWLPLFDSN